jgi:pimeloyl-ACP methyl ester carboxylesterase
MDGDRSYACDVARRRMFAVNGLRLHALEWGEAGRPGLCFLHGGAAHAHWFDAVVPAFAGRYHVISLDQRGHGESQWAAPPAYATEDFASDLSGVMDLLGWRQMALVGHSMGGHNAMAFAAWYPDRLWALCVVDSRPGIPRERLEAMHRRGHRGPRPHPSLDVALRHFRLLPKDTTADPGLLAHLGRRGIVERDGRFIYRFDPACNGRRRPIDAWPLLPAIQAPALLVRGEHSPILPAPMAAEMRRLIVRAQVTEIPKAYHHLVLDAPGAFSRALERFLSASARAS